MVADITIRDIKLMRVTSAAPIQASNGTIRAHFVALKVLSDHDEVPLYLIFSDNAKGEAFVNAINTLFPQQDKEVKGEKDFIARTIPFTDKPELCDRDKV